MLLVARSSTHRAPEGSLGLRLRRQGRGWADVHAGGKLERCACSPEHVLTRRGAAWESRHVAGSHAQLAAVLDAGPDSDAEELAELTGRLRSELLEIDVDAVEPATEGEAPTGAKAVELLASGGLVIRFAMRTEVLRSVVDATGAWLSRQQGRRRQADDRGRHRTRRRREPPAPRSSPGSAETTSRSHHARSWCGNPRTAT